MSQRIFVRIIVVILMSSAQSLSLSTTFKILNECVCPQYTSSYECTVGGEGFTLWRGSAFDCRLSGNQIILRHSRFDSGTSASCNNGVLVGHSLSTTQNYYTSRLDVNVTASLEGTNLECAYENGSSTSFVIGSSLISITRDPFPPPSRVWLVFASRELLVFQWSSVTANCPAIFYNITSTCGDCPKSTTMNNVSCSISSVHVNTTCTFAVRSVVCGDIAGDLSTPVKVSLKVPESPAIYVIAKYGTEGNQSLINMDARLRNKNDTLILSEGIDGSPLYYNVSYSDSSRVDSHCGTVNLTISSSCVNGMCTTTLPQECYQLSGGITMSTASSNAVGMGPEEMTHIETTNKYVEVTFRSATDIVCTFINDMKSESKKSCSITYGKCQQRLFMTASGTTSADSPNTIYLELESTQKTYCYIINASNDTVTVLMEGTHNDTDVDCTNSLIVIVVVTITNVVLIFAYSFSLYMYIKHRISYQTHVIKNGEPNRLILD